MSVSAGKQGFEWCEGAHGTDGWKDPLCCAIPSEKA